MCINTDYTKGSVALIDLINFFILELYTFSFKNYLLPRNVSLLFHLFMHSLVESRMCPDRGLNP